MRPLQGKSRRSDRRTRGTARLALSTSAPTQICDLVGRRVLGHPSFRYRWGTRWDGVQMMGLREVPGDVLPDGRPRPGTWRSANFLNKVVPGRARSRRDAAK